MGSTVATRDPVRPRTKPQEVRRDELLASGERLFLERGVAATSIDDIAAGAGVAKGTFYLYFDSKEAMHEALHERFGESMRSAVEARIARERAGDWSARLRAWVEGSIDFYLDEAALHDAIFHARDFHPRRRTVRSDNGVVDVLAALLTEARNAGAWTIEDPAMTAVLLFEALHGAVDHAIARQIDGKRDRLVKLVQEFALRAVASIPAPRR
jgi:AcrR family transcriptional regulator